MASGDFWNRQIDLARRSPGRASCSDDPMVSRRGAGRWAEGWRLTSPRRPGLALSYFDIVTAKSELLEFVSAVITTVRHPGTDPGLQ
jgi:hypothetical protein